MSTRRYRSRLQITERKRHDYFVVYFQEFTGKKNLPILSTHEGMLVVIKDDRKSWLYKLYDFTYLSPKNEFYMTKTKCRRWNNTAISKHNQTQINLDTTRVNTSTIFGMYNNKHLIKKITFKLFEDLLNQMIAPFVLRFSANPAGSYMIKVNNRNARTRCKICSKLTIRTPEQRHWRLTYFTSCYSVSVVNFGKINGMDQDGIQLKMRLFIKSMRMKITLWRL